MLIEKLAVIKRIALFSEKCLYIMVLMLRLGRNEEWQNVPNVEKK